MQLILDFIIRSKGITTNDSFHSPTPSDSRISTLSSDLQLSYYPQILSNYTLNGSNYTKNSSHFWQIFPTQRLKPTAGRKASYWCLLLLCSDTYVSLKDFHKGSYSFTWINEYWLIESRSIHLIRLDTEGRYKRQHRPQVKWESLT